MKRFVMPIIMIVVGGLLFIPYIIVINDPSTELVGAGFSCDTYTSIGGVNCEGRTYLQSHPEAIPMVGVLVGIVSIVCGIAIGLYRLAKRE